jgi:GNAT superfamily N-acetyltransferase
MKSEVIILPVGNEHLMDIAALAQVVWRAHYPGIISLEQIEYMLARMYAIPTMENELAGGICYDRLILGEELVGFASYGPAAANEIKLHKLYVHPQRQRRGFGTLLLEHVCAETSRLGFSRMILSVNKANTKAIAAYQKNGFVIREAAVVDIGGGFVMDDFVMERGINDE